MKPYLVCLFLLFAVHPSWAWPRGQGSEVESADQGHMEPKEVNSLLEKLWRNQYRLKDLLAQVDPQKHVGEAHQGPG